MKSVCVYLGSSPGARVEYAEAARALGVELAGRGLQVVYGGGNVGLMGVLADAALGAGGQVLGVIPAALDSREVGHHGLTELRVVSSMHERKLAMMQAADAFVVLPGGIGTLEELFETLTWLQLGVHDKPIGLLDVADYFAPMVAFLERMVDEGFWSRAHADLLQVNTEAGRLLDLLAEWVVPPRAAWLDPEQV